MENRAGNHAPPRYAVCCRQSCLNPRVETHCHLLLLHSPSPRFFRSSSLTFPFRCPRQSNSWEAADVHAQHVPYPCPPPFPIGLQYLAAFLSNIRSSFKMPFKRIESVFCTLPVAVQRWFIICPWNYHFVSFISVTSCLCHSSCSKRFLWCQGLVPI